jgi:hypothetical protein
MKPFHVMPNGIRFGVFDAVGVFVDDFMTEKDALLFANYLNERRNDQNPNS